MVDGWFRLRNVGNVLTLILIHNNNLTKFSVFSKFFDRFKKKTIKLLENDSLVGTYFFIKNKLYVYEMIQWFLLLKLKINLLIIFISYSYSLNWFQFKGARDACKSDGAY